MRSLTLSGLGGQPEVVGPSKIPPTFPPNYPARCVTSPHRCSPSDPKRLLRRTMRHQPSPFDTPIIGLTTTRPSVRIGQRPLRTSAREGGKGKGREKRAQRQRGDGADGSPAERT